MYVNRSLRQTECEMSKRWLMLMTGCVAIGYVPFSSAESAISKAEYYAIADKAAADFRDAHAVCDTLQGNAQTICVEEAKLAQTIAKGSAEARYKNTAQARTKASTDIANAQYAVAKARCEDKQDNDKDACLRYAVAAHAMALAQAKSGTVMAQVVTDSRDAKPDAAMMAALEKCNALTGISKESCVADLKSKIGR